MKVKEILKVSQALLRDLSGNLYQMPDLLPYFSLAYSEMFEKMLEHNVSAVQTQTADLTVSTSGEYPLIVDIADPIEVVEKVGGGYIPMRQVRKLPNIEKTDRLRYWTWNSDILEFLGGNQDIEIRVSYRKTPEVVSNENENLSIVGVLPFLSTRTAATYALTYLNKIALSDRLNVRADDHLDSLLNIKIQAKQGIPVRRRISLGPRRI